MYKYFAWLLLLLVSGIASASVVTVDMTGYGSSSVRDNKDNVKNKDSVKNKGIVKKRTAISYSHIEFAPNPFNTAAFKQDQGRGKSNSWHDESSAVTFSVHHRNSDVASRRFDFDSSNQGDRRSDHGKKYYDREDNHVFESEFHDGKHDYIGEDFEYWHCDSPDTNPVPLPAAAWLFMSGLAGLLRLGHRRKK